jgi:hypothetical protein
MITALTGIRRAVAVILAASLGVCCLPSGAAIAQNEAVLILDNSGSMWGRMDGTPKISVVRDAVGSLLKEKAGKLDLGILAYGTQKSKDCSSTETLKPIGAIDPAADAKTVDGANPKGSAPVAASLTAASQLFQTKTGVRSIILLSDSTDDCKADPCAVAEQLKAQSPLTVIHVIGFDEKSEDELQELACISEQTSGVFQTAQTPGELNEALRKAIELAELGMTENAEGRQIPILALPQAGFGPGGENSFTSNEPGTLVPRPACLHGPSAIRRPGAPARAARCSRSGGPRTTATASRSCAGTGPAGARRAPGARPARCCPPGTRGGTPRYPGGRTPTRAGS